MVLQILADAGQVADQWNIEVAEVLRRANTGEHEQLRRSDRASAQNNFALSSLLYAAVALLKAHDCRALAFKINSERMCASAHSEVGPRCRWMQKGRGRAVPLAVKLRYLIKA